MPLKSARKALWFMNTDQRAAPGAGPLVRFGADELSYAVFPDALKIVDHAHPVPALISFIKVFQAPTGIAVAIEAVLDPPLNEPLTVLYPAGHAALWFKRIITPAPRT
jgi:hypothetical protein